LEGGFFSDKSTCHPGRIQAGLIDLIIAWLQNRRKRITYQFLTNIPALHPEPGTGPGCIFSETGFTVLARIR
jgi:hypothetical protein